MPDENSAEDAARRRASEDLLDALRTGRPGSAAKHLLGELVPLVRELIALGVDLPASAMLTPARFRQHLVRACGLDSEEGVEAIIAAVESAADTIFAERTRATSSEGVRATKKDASDAITEFTQRFALDVLRVQSELGGSRSGAYVARVYFRRGERESFGILKLMEGEDDYEKELAGHSEVLGSWMAGMCVPEPLCASLERSTPWGFALLSEVSLPDSYGRPSQTLGSLVTSRRRSASLESVARIGAAYGGHLLDPNKSLREDFDQCEFAKMVVRRWGETHSDDVWNTDAYWAIGDLPGPSEAEFLDGKVWKVNPLWLLTHGPGPTATFLTSLQHGDLNPENILVGDETVRFIDLEKVDKTSALLDPLWLSLWLLMESQGSLPPTAATTEHLPEVFFSACIGNPAPDIDLGDLQFGCDLTSRLMSAVRDEAETTSFLPLVLPLQIRLTAGAAALGMAFYEVRSVERSLMRGTNSERPRYWARQFFRIATVALAEVAWSSSAAST